jgi:hypothetical protein
VCWWESPGEEQVRGRGFLEGCVCVCVGGWVGNRKEVVEGRRRRRRRGRRRRREGEEDGIVGCVCVCVCVC